jgi:NAD(P)-dependent dehydrogenase (short-subunit alcohol dehydrogenase family)
VDDLTGRVAVVTGAASGIGRAMAERFGAEGMKVVLADVEERALEETAAQLAADGLDVLGVRTDVTDADDVDDLAKRAVEHFGAVHVVCNNAGVQQDGVLWEFSFEQWEWILGVNLWGTIYGVKAFVPGMIERGEPGHVVNTASIGGLITYPRLGMYSAAKAGVIALSETLHHDLREAGAPIGVSVLCPGPVMSGLREHSRALRPAGSGTPPPSLVTDIDRTPAFEVASQVLDAIRADRFWILTHPEYKGLIEQRFRGIVETDEVVEATIL